MLHVALYSWPYSHHQVFLVITTGEVGAAGVQWVEAGVPLTPYSAQDGLPPSQLVIRPQRQRGQGEALGETLIFTKEGQRALRSPFDP